MAMQESERQYTERLLREMIDDARAKEDALAEEARSATAKAARAMAAKVAAKTGAVLAKAAKPALPRTAGPARTAGDDLPAAAQVAAAETIQASRDSLIDDLFPRTEWPTPPKAEFPRLGKKPDRRSDFVVAALGVTLGLICALFPWYIFFNQEQFGVQAIKFGGSGSNAGRVSGGSQMENPGQPLTAKDVPDVDLFATGTLQDPEDPAEAPGVDQQPFPADPKFRMVHVANGRAMIEDDAGLWIVQRGSKLPDSSIVSSIEQRGGKWVMVTSTDQVIDLSR